MQKLTPSLVSEGICFKAFWNCGTLEYIYCDLEVDTDEGFAHIYHTRLYLLSDNRTILCRLHANTSRGDFIQNEILDWQLDTKSLNDWSIDLKKEMLDHKFSEHLIDKINELETSISCKQQPKSDTPSNILPDEFWDLPAVKKIFAHRKYNNLDDKDMVKIKQQIGTGNLEDFIKSNAMGFDHLVSVDLDYENDYTNLFKDLIWARTLYLHRLIFNDVMVARIEDLKDQIYELESALL